MKILIVGMLFMNLLFGADKILLNISEATLSSDKKTVEYNLGETIRASSDSFSLEFDYYATCPKIQNTYKNAISCTDQNGNSISISAPATPGTTKTCEYETTYKILYPCTTSTLRFSQNSQATKSSIDLRLDGVVVNSSSSLGLKSASIGDATSTKKLHVKMDYTFDKTDAKVSLTITDKSNNTSFYKQDGFGQLDSFNGLILEGSYGFTPATLGVASIDTLIDIPKSNIFSNLKFTKTTKDIDTTASGQDFKFTITDGWNLKGITSGITDLKSTFTENCVKSVWAFQNGAWKIYYPSQSNSTLEKIDNYDGFWINAKTSCTIGEEAPPSPGSN